MAPPKFRGYGLTGWGIKTSTKEIGDTIATSIARYGKYRCWASKVGELRAADPSKCTRANEANTRPGEQCGAPRRRWKPGQEQHPGPENWNSPNKLNQPRESFLDQRALLRNHGSKPPFA